jgi:hypothetical protein
MVLPGKRNSTSLRNKPVNEDHGHHWTDIVDRKITWNDVLNKPDIPSAASLAQAIAVPPVYEVDEWSFKNIRLRDTNRTNRLSMIWNEDDTADRQLKLQVSGASPILDIEADTYLNQDLTTDAGPEFDHVHLDSIFEKSVKNGILIQAFDLPINILSNSSIAFAIDKQNLDDCTFAVKHNTTDMFVINSGNPGVHQFIDSQCHLQMNGHNITDIGTLGAISSVDINGGTIDGTTIGGSVAAAITGTTVQATTLLKFDHASQITAAHGNVFDGKVGIGLNPVVTFHSSTNGVTPHSSLYLLQDSAVFSGTGSPILRIIDAEDTATNRGSLIGTKSRGTLDAPTALVSGDYVFSFVAAGYDGSAIQNSAGVFFGVDGTVSSGVVPTKIFFMTGNSTGTRLERMSIGSDGKILLADGTAIGQTAGPLLTFDDTNNYLEVTGCNVGIGTTTPASLLAISGGDNKDTGPILNLFGAAVNQVESGRIRFGEASMGTSYQGGFIHYNGSTNTLIIGTHSTVDVLTANDINAMTFARDGSTLTVTPQLDFTTAHGTTTLTDHLGEHVVGHGVVVDNNVGIGRTPTSIFDAYSATLDVVAMIATGKADGGARVDLVNDTNNWAFYLAGNDGDAFVIRDITNSKNRLTFRPAGYTYFYDKNGSSALEITDSPVLVSRLNHYFAGNIYIDHIYQNTAAHTVIFGSSVTLADTAILSMQEYIEFTGATGTGYIKMVDNLADAFSIQEGVNKYMTFCTTNGAELITDYKAHAFDTLTASTIVYASAAKVLTSLANAAGALTNDGAGALTWVAYSAAAHTHAGVYQPLDATLTSLALLGTAADKLAYTTAADTWAEAAITAAGRAILDDANAAAQRVTLGLEIGVNVQAYNAALFTPAYLFTYKAAEAALLTDTWEDVEFNGGDPVKVGITHDYAGANPGNMTIITAGTYEIDATALFRGNNASGVQMHIMYVTSGGGAVEIPGSWMEDSFHDYSNISAHALRSRVLVTCAADSWIQVEVAVQNAASQIGYIDIGQNPDTWITATCLITRVG